MEISGAIRIGSFTPIFVSCRAKYFDCLVGLVSKIDLAKEVPSPFFLKNLCCLFAYNF